MRLFELLRVACRQDVTLGVLIDVGAEADADSPGEPFAVTCERPWLDNAPELSCIPAGPYVCRRINSPRFGQTFEVTDVPGRDKILFHRGNTSADTHGCILVAESFSRINDLPGVGQSAPGFEEFCQRLAGESSFRLIVSVA